MAKGQTIRLVGNSQRMLAQRLIAAAPQNAVVEIREATRSTEQNSRMWALISDVSRAKPEGRVHTAEVWKALFMHSCGHAVQFENGLNGQPFPIGFRSSRLSKAEMGDLMTVIEEYGGRHGVVWSEPERAAA